MTPTHSLVSDLAIPEWSSFLVTTYSNIEAYVASLGNVVVGYCIFTSNWCVGEENPSECVDVGSIQSLEVHPDYRRQGIAKGLMDILQSSFPSKSFVVQPLRQAHCFYDALGFTVLFMDYGPEQCTLIRAAGGLSAQRLYDLYEMSDFYSETANNFLMGCRWSESQKRWIWPGRSYAEELLAVSENPSEIERVTIQTPELQRIALAAEPDVIFKIACPDMTVTDSFSEELSCYTCNCVCAIRTHSLCVECPSGT